jgi:predicted phosphodiesterase
MRILALYDIHGNPDALEAVLADPRAAGPDAIVVGGDAVPGAFAGAVLDRLQALSRDVHWVRGNGERETAAAVKGPRPAEGDNAAEMSAFTAQQLGPERAGALGELPLSLVVDGVLFCHATPRSDEELVTRISPPERWSEVLSDVDAALVVAGHTHQQDDRMVGGCASSTPAAWACPTRATAMRGGCGSRTASRSCGAPPTTRPPPAGACAMPVRP